MSTKYKTMSSMIVKHMSRLLLAGALLTQPSVAVAADQGELADLKKVVAVQQALIGRMAADIAALKEKSATKEEAKNVLAAANARIDKVLNGGESFGSIVFANGTKIIQDQGISIFPVNERNNVASPFYYHFGSSFEAWRNPYNDDHQVIWSWK